MSELRDYQQDAVDAAKEWMKSSTSPCLIEAPTGSGKSHVVAALADWLHDISGGKRVLCLAPQRELCLQNAAKMRAIHPCSIFSASAGVKSTKHPIVFATPRTVSNSISRFTRGDYCAIVIDEAHTIAPTVLAIIEEMRQANPNLRVVGLSATPFKLGKGFIYRIRQDGRVNEDDVCRDPIFAKLVYSIDARYLIEKGYLTPPVIGAINTGAYDTSGLVMRPNGQFDAASVDAAFVGFGRKTSAIVGDVVGQARNRKGVVFFAATVMHAQEVLASLPPELSAIVTGETEDRDKILARFERQEIKYLCNVNVLSVGWDCPHVDVIALLRRTESVGLLQQQIGRGLRLSPGKADCLILDYASNLSTHCPDGDLFKPIVRAKGAKGPGEPIEAECPECGYVNEFSLQPDYADFARDKAGYCLDVFGNQLMSEYGPVAAHYGRRCFGMVRAGSRGEYERCGHRYNSKDCPACEAPNDIAARFCTVCAAEIVDPNERLIGEFVARKKDPTQPQTDRVLSFETRESVSQKGNATIRVDFVTPYRQFSCWFMKEPTNARAKADLARWEACGGNPETVSYVRDADSQFWRILAFGKPADDDELPLMLADDSKIEKLRKYA